MLPLFVTLHSYTHTLLQQAGHDISPRNTMQRNHAADNSPFSPPTQESDFFLQIPLQRVINKQHLSPYSVDVIGTKELL